MRNENKVVHPNNSHDINGICNARHIERIGSLEFIKHD